MEARRVLGISLQVGHLQVGHQSAPRPKVGVTRRRARRAKTDARIAGELANPSQNQKKKNSQPPTKIHRRRDLPRPPRPRRRTRSCRPRLVGQVRDPRLYAVRSPWVGVLLYILQEVRGQTARTSVSGQLEQAELDPDQTGTRGPKRDGDGGGSGPKGGGPGGSEAARGATGAGKVRSHPVTTRGTATRGARAAGTAAALVLTQRESTARASLVEGLSWLKASSRRIILDGGFSQAREEPGGLFVDRTTTSLPPGRPSQREL